MLRLLRNPVFLLAVLTAVGLLLLTPLTGVRKGIGSFSYDVRLVSAVPVMEIRYNSFGNRDWAEESRDYKYVDRREPVRPEEREGDQFTAQITFYSSEPVLGCRSSYVQHRYLVVVALLADGRRVAKLVDVPDTRESREITIHLD